MSRAGRNFGDEKTRTKKQLIVYENGIQMTHCFSEHEIFEKVLMFNWRAR